MADQPETTEPKKKSPLFALLKAVAFISVLVVVEVVAASLLIPTPQETEELAKSLAAAKAGEEPIETDDGTAITEAQTRTEEETVEVELGPFNVNHFNPDADKMISIDFELFAVVLAAEAEQFHTEFEKHRNRVRDQVNMTLRSADTKQLTDPGLGLIKRRILEKTNRSLGKPLVREILTTRFNFVER